MGTTVMHRIRTVVTGVPGSPYYLNAYFDGDSPVNACHVAWATFCGATGSAASTASGVTITTEGQVLQVSPVTGDVVGSIELGPVSVTGSQVTTLAPPQSQAVYTLRTGVYAGGREIRGRFHMPLIRVDNLVSGPAGAGSLQDTPYNAYLARGATLIATSGVNWVVWAKSQGRWEEIAAAPLRRQLGTLRSRAAFP